MVLELCVAQWNVKYKALITSDLSRRLRAHFYTPFSVSCDVWVCAAPMPPLCKGRWHGAAVTEGLLALDFPPHQNRCRRGGHCPPAFLRPHSFLSLFGERKEPPQRQKKPAPFRFRRGGESSIFAASFFLPESRPLRWVAFRFQ